MNKWVMVSAVFLLISCDQGEQPGIEFSSSICNDCLSSESIPEDQLFFSANEGLSLLSDEYLGLCDQADTLLLPEEGKALQVEGLLYSDCPDGLRHIEIDSLLIVDHCIKLDSAVRPNSLIRDWGFLYSSKLEDHFPCELDGAKMIIRQGQNMISFGGLQLSADCMIREQSFQTFNTVYTLDVLPTSDGREFANAFYELVAHEDDTTEVAFQIKDNILTLKSTNTGDYMTFYAEK